MILDAFEVRPEQQDFFIPLIWKYMPDSKILAEVLAFKFSFFQTGVVPQSLYTVTALMLQHGLIGLSDIYGWVSTTSFSILLSFIVNYSSVIIEARCLYNTESYSYVNPTNTL